MAKQKNYQKMHHMKKFYALIHEVLPFYVYTILDGPFGFSSYSFLPFSFSFPLIFFFFFFFFLFLLRIVLFFVWWQSSNNFLYTSTKCHYIIAYDHVECPCGILQPFQIIIKADKKNISSTSLCLFG